MIYITDKYTLEKIEEATRTIQRNWQHWVHKSQDEDKQTQHRKLKRRATWSRETKNNKIGVWYPISMQYWGVTAKTVGSKLKSN